MKKGDYYAKQGIDNFKKGKYEDALTDLNLAKEFETDTFKQYVIYNNIGSVKFKLNDYIGSVEAYLTSLSINPEYFESWSGLGAAYLKIGDKDKALDVLNTAILFDPLDETSITLYINLGYIYISKNKPISAIKYLEKASEISPDSSTVFAYLSIAYAQAFEYDKSDEAFIKAQEFGYLQCSEVEDLINQIKNK